MTAKRNTPDDPGLYDIDDIRALTRTSATWVREQVAAGNFPAPIIQLPRCTRWRRSDVHAWCASPSASANAAGRQRT